MNIPLIFILIFAMAEVAMDNKNQATPKNQISQKTGHPKDILVILRRDWGYYPLWNGMKLYYRAKHGYVKRLANGHQFYIRYHDAMKLITQAQTYRRKIETQRKKTG